MAKAPTHLSKAKKVLREIESLQKEMKDSKGAEVKGIIRAVIAGKKKQLKEIAKSASGK